MNNNKKLLVPICFLAAIIIFVALIILLAKDPIAEYRDLESQKVRQDNEFQSLEKRVNEVQTAQEQEELKLKSIKHIYEATNTANEDLSIFGNMFDDIIKLAQSNKLLIRSIEYEMNPTSDPIYAEFSDIYNVCELKFFFVGTYDYFQGFLRDINESFEYLASISTIKITTFKETSETKIKINYLI